MEPKPFNNSAWTAASQSEARDEHCDPPNTQERWSGNVPPDTMQVEAALRESEARFRNLADAMPQLIWTALPNGTVNYYNSRAAEYAGIQQNAEGEWGWQTVLHPDDLAPTIAAWNEAVATGTTYQMEHRIQMLDGTFRWHLSRAFPVEGRNSDVLWYGTATNIDDQKRTEEALRASEAHFRALADNIAQLAWMADSTGALFWYNRRWFEFTGTTLEEMQGWGWQKVHHPDYVVAVTEKFQRHLDSGEVWEDTFPLRGADGQYRWFLSRAIPIRDDRGQVSLWFGTNTDITAQREAERTLRQHQDELEVLNLRLRRAMKETHHRVKNNLQVIASLVEVQALGSEIVSVSALHRITGHVLSLAALHDALTERSAVLGEEGSDGLNAREFIGRLVPLLRGALMGIELRYSCFEFLLTLQQASALALLINELVSNAVKHGQGEVTLSIEPEGREQARLEVRDSGPGFSVDFDPRRDFHTGLEIVMTLARHDLQGDIRFENRPEGGARVMVVFPLRRQLTENEPIE